MEKNILSSFAILCSFVATAQQHTDLADMGYRGPVQQVITRLCLAINFENGQWVVTDSIRPVTTLIESVNKQGNYIQKEIHTPYDTSMITYSYLNGVKTGWTKTNSNGVVLATALFRYSGQDSIAELTSYIDDSSTAISTYVLDKEGHIAILKDKIMDRSGKISSSLITYNEDDKEGRYWRTRTIDQLTHQTEVFEFSFLQKDRYDNPVRILVKKNDKPFEIRLVSILYYQ